MGFKPKSPTHLLKAKDKAGETAFVGRCWLNDDGSMSIKLNVGCQLSWRDDLQLTAFPKDANDGDRRKPLRSTDEED